MAHLASPDGAPRWSITVLAAHARYVPAAEREQLAIDLRAQLDGGGLVVETCHRVERYASAGGLDGIPVPHGVQVLRGEAAIRHAVSVAVGRDSVVVGEDQVLHQVRAAVNAARAEGRLDPVLERLFSVALRAGRRARSWAPGTERSLATVALATIERRVGPLSGRRVLVVGAGRMGRLVAQAAAAAGTSVAIANRSPERGAVLARDVRGETAPFDPGSRVGEFTALIVAIDGSWSISPATGRALTGSTAPVVDLSVPSAVADDLAAELDARLITADDLARTQTESPDHRHLLRLDSLIERAVSDFLAWLDGQNRRSTAAALAREAEHARAAELAVLWRRLPDLDPASRAAIDQMTRHLAERLLREPLERLGRDADGRTERAVRDVFAL